MKYDYLVVGAGLFGTVFAREMTNMGKKCLVIDKRDHIAGNIYTEEMDGIYVHRYGAHIFHTSDMSINIQSLISILIPRWRFMEMNSIICHLI